MALDILDVITSFERTADQFLSKDEFKKRLRSRKQQRVKYTIDVKTDTLHIGHAVNLWMIRRLQDMGHKAVIVFTDFTSRIGDKDGRLETIASYPKKVLERKIRDLTQQACLILRNEPELIEFHRNSEWYGTIKFHDMMNLFSLVTHAKLISRDVFQMAVAEGRELYINEMLYPVLQGYDSYMVSADISIIGSDQLFNESLGRLIQEKHRKKPQTLITTRMTPGIDGKAKQSQRRDNNISLAHGPRDKFGRVMSIPDNLIRDYFLVYTDVPQADIAALDSVIAQQPREAKARLAVAIVARYHGEAAALEERDWFENTVARGYPPEDLPTLAVATDKMEALDLVVLAQPERSRGDSRRLILQGGVDLNGHKLKSPEQTLSLQSNDTLRLGKRLWFRIEVATVGALDTENLWMRPCHLADMDQILARIPTPEMAQYLLRLQPGKKEKTATALEKLKKILLQPQKNQEALFAIFSKTDPQKMIGLSHLRWQGPQGMQHMWLDPSMADRADLQDAMRALGKHAFDELHLEIAASPNSALAYAFANIPEMLYEAQRKMDQTLLSREDAFGMAGFTKEGWDKMQQWRRISAPWLYTNEPTQSRHGQAFKKNMPQKKPPDPAGPGEG